MKILQVTNRLPYPLNDGGNIATYNVTRFLHEKGHEVHLASLNTSKHYTDPAHLESLAKVFTTYLDNKITLLQAVKGFFQKEPFNVTRFYTKEFKRLLTELVEKNDYDIIQLEGIYLSQYIPALKKYTDAPVILRSHNIEHQIWGRYAENEKNLLKKIFLSVLVRKIRKFERKHLHYFDGIIAITRRDEGFYQQEGYQGALTTISAGVDPELFGVESESKKTKSVCFLGSLEWVPNVQGLEWFLTHVWPRVRAAEPEAEFHVAGKNPPGWLEKLSVPGMVFHGMVPDSVEFLKKYGVVVVPLFSGGGMRLKVVESMALKKAIVTTSVGVEGIRVKNGKNIFIANKKQDFYELTLSLLKDQDKKEKIGQAARETAFRYYSWNSLIKRFEDFYRNLCE